MSASQNLAFSQDPMYRVEAAQFRRQAELVEEIVDQVVDELPLLERIGGDQPFDGFVQRLQSAFTRRLGTGPRFAYVEPGPRRRPLSVQQSLAVFARDDYACVECGER